MSFDFVALDVETANQRRGSICAVGLAVVEDGQVVRREHWLTRPLPGLPGWMNTWLHGIGPADVRDEPEWDVRVRQLVDAIDGRPVVAHNAAFDIGAVREACTEYEMDWPTLTYGCSMVMSRRALHLISYRLPVVCAALAVPLPQHHRADYDAEAAAGVLLALAQRTGAGSLDDLAEALNVRLGRLLAREWVGCVNHPKGSSSFGGGSSGLGPPPGANPDADPNHPLFGQVIVFTGGLSMHRADAWECAARFGAWPEKNVTKRTTMLVVGDGFTGQTVDEFHTDKALQAAKLCAQGQRIEALTELDWLQLIADDKTSGAGSAADARHSVPARGGVDR